MKNKNPNIDDTMKNSSDIDKEYAIIMANKVIVKLLYSKDSPIKVCKTQCILYLNTFFFSDFDGEEFDKLYEEVYDDVAPSSVVADSRVFLSKCVLMIPNIET